jgi:hypothetical protein
MGFDLASMTIDHVDLTDVTGGETLARFPVHPQEILIGDRGYAHRRGFRSVIDAHAHFIVRLNWQNMPLQHPDGKSFDLLKALRSLPEAEPAEHDVTVAPSSRPRLPALPARLVAVRKSEAAAEAARKKVLQERRRRGKGLDPHSLESAGYVFVLTSLPADALSAMEVLELYRFRWQVELAFKRLKSLLQLSALPARDPPLARSFLFAKLLAALLVEDFTDKFLAFFPWGYRLERASTLPVAHPTSSD